jgi:hypothetical protein
MGCGSSIKLRQRLPQQGSAISFEHKTGKDSWTVAEQGEICPWLMLKYSKTLMFMGDRPTEQSGKVSVVGGPGSKELFNFDIAFEMQTLEFQHFQKKSGKRCREDCKFRLVVG